MTRKIQNDGCPIDVGGGLDDLGPLLREEPGLAAVYLYGSYATPHQTPLSDVDLALVFRPDEDPEFDHHLRLIGRVTGALGEEDVSVTILNRAPVLFQRKVLRDGRRLLVFDEIGLADFVERVLNVANDFDLDYRRFLREYDEARAEEHRTVRRSGP